MNEHNKAALNTAITTLTEYFESIPDDKEFGVFSMTQTFEKHVIMYFVLTENPIEGVLDNREVLKKGLELLNKK